MQTFILKYYEDFSTLEVIDERGSRRLCVFLKSNH